MSKNIIGDIACNIGLALDGCQKKDWLKPEGQTMLPATLENIRALIAEMGKGKTDAEQCKLWYDIELMAFNELGEVYVDTWKLSAQEVYQTIAGYYSTISDFKFPDSSYFVTDLTGMQKILTRDWTNMVPYISETGDCDKFANRLYEHCSRYYKINTVFPVWGSSPMGYHAYNCTVLKQGENYIARLIEPQTDEMFIDKNQFGLYVPDKIVLKLADLQ